MKRKTIIPLLCSEYPARSSIPKKQWFYGRKKKFNCPWVLKVRWIVISPWTPGHESDFKIDVARNLQVFAPMIVKVLFIFYCCWKQQFCGAISRWLYAKCIRTMLKN